MSTGDKTCRTCRYYEAKPVVETVGMWKKKTVHSTEHICYRFGVTGQDARKVRCGYIDIYGHQRDKPVCGDEGKYWEEK